MEGLERPSDEGTVGVNSEGVSSVGVNSLDSVREDDEIVAVGSSRSDDGPDEGELAGGIVDGRSTDQGPDDVLNEGDKTDDITEGVPSEGGKGMSRGSMSR